MKSWISWIPPFLIKETVLNAIFQKNIINKHNKHSKQARSINSFNFPFKRSLWLSFLWLLLLETRKNSKSPFHKHCIIIVKLKIVIKMIFSISRFAKITVSKDSSILMRSIRRKALQNGRPILRQFLDSRIFFTFLMFLQYLIFKPKSRTNYKVLENFC